MKPLDPRLVRTVAPVRTHLGVTVVAGGLRTGLILVQAWLLAHAIARATGGAPLAEVLAADRTPGRIEPVLTLVDGKPLVTLPDGRTVRLGAVP